MLSTTSLQSSSISTFDSPNLRIQEIASRNPTASASCGRDLPSYQIVAAFTNKPRWFWMHIHIPKQFCCSNMAASTLHLTNSSSGGCQFATCCYWFCTGSTDLFLTSCNWKSALRASCIAMSMGFNSPSHTLSFRGCHRHQSITTRSLLSGLDNLHSKEKKQSVKLAAASIVSLINSHNPAVHQTFFASSHPMKICQSFS